MKNQIIGRTVSQVVQVFISMCIGRSRGIENVENYIKSILGA
jgi:hypothetical protein